MEPLISEPRTVIPAWNIKTKDFMKVLEGAAELEGIGAYQIGAVPILEEGLRRVTADLSDKKKMYHHWGLGGEYAQFASPLLEQVKGAGIDGVILTGISGPDVFRHWVGTARRLHLDVALEAILPHDRFLSCSLSDPQDNQGGYVLPEQIVNLHKVAVEEGITTFIMPSKALSYSRAVETVKRDAKLVLGTADCTVLYRGIDGLLDLDVFHEITPSDVLPVGIPKVVNLVREYTSAPLILDWQSLGTYTPNRIEDFLHALNAAEGATAFHGVKVLPLAGPQALSKAVEMAHGRTIIAEGHRTHEDYCGSRKGIIETGSPEIMIQSAIDEGIRDIAFPASMVTEVRNALTFLPRDVSLYLGGQGTMGAKSPEQYVPNLPARVHRVIGHAFTQARDAGGVEAIAREYVASMRN